MNEVSGGGRKTVMGLPAELIWGYVATVIFMVGDGLEQGWLSPYLIERGLTVQQSATLFAVYGAVLAVASYFSGVLTEAWGPRRVMAAGMVIWLVGEVLFIIYGIQRNNYAVMLPTYAIRGFGYPLFCYSFLVWVTYRSPQHVLATAIGIFWAAWIAGVNVIGSYYPAYTIPWIGPIGTLWSAVIWVLVGGLLGIFLVKGKVSDEPANPKEKLSSLISGLTICIEKPKVALCGIVRTINTTGIGALPVFFPLYLSSQYGISTEQWLKIWGTMWLANIAGDVVIAYISDKWLGWRNTVMWIGSVGCGLASLILLYMPEFFGRNLWLITLAGIFYGAALTGYVPISAIVTSLAPDKKGSAMAVVSFGAGLSYFISPAIVGSFIGSIGVHGVMWIFAILYFISAILMIFIRLPESTEVPATEN
ncbi:MFS transporter [Aneurinibacillus sp. Ricciae_BoGa-3]|uniref:MFS transporter n=1 Tax=Aneurinibacillus sp. Ricciae_BoGa-3 TaxID=3022697 RepID=UPI00233F8E33|nr:MFS transporter [Aneurinibacillus sp. Ricciae_BoGa-3]WCK54711.1 MFS transporter [Aneurinibacillus sp. Ricciae_BoGa-3]